MILGGCYMSMSLVMASYCSQPDYQLLLRIVNPASSSPILYVPLLPPPLLHSLSPSLNTWVVEID